MINSKRFDFVLGYDLALDSVYYVDARSYAKVQFRQGYTSLTYCLACMYDYHDMLISALPMCLYG